MHPSTAETIRILLVEDSYITRIGTATVIATQKDMKVVGEAADGAAAIEAYRTLKPDVLMVDIRIPKFDGVQVTAAVVKEDPKAQVLVLTNSEGDESVFSALKAGARGYLTKAVPPAELLTAIRAVHRGQRYLPTQVAALLADRLLQPSLTRREVQVLEMVFKGLSNRAIATELAISDRTVGLYVSSIMEKLGAKNRTEAVSMALARGIIYQG